MSTKIGVLLVNLGTPQSPKPSAVFRYLIEFLTDSRVIDIPWLRRQLLVRGLIVPTRYRASAAAYSQVWTEEGSPLLLHSQRAQKLLQQSLGSNYTVLLAMRYQKPSIQAALKQLQALSLCQLIVIPLFPQYASATTGSVHQAVMKEVGQWNVIPELSFISQYATHPAFIAAFVARLQAYSMDDYDHLLFSFHGLPERHIRKADRFGSCLQAGCCDSLHCANADCYSAQCYATARSIASALKIPSTHYSICFQSRLGKEPWLSPYTSDVLHDLLKAGTKRLLVASPAFVADCLETVGEIALEYAEEFYKGGGKTLDLVPSLNDSPLWIEALKTFVLERSTLTGSPQSSNLRLFQPNLEALCQIHK